MAGTSGILYLLMCIGASALVCSLLCLISTIIVGVYVVKPVVDGCEVEDRHCQVVAYNYTATSITVAFNLLPATDNNNNNPHSS